MLNTLPLLMALPACERKKVHEMRDAHYKLRQRNNKGLLQRTLHSRAFSETSPGTFDGTCRQHTGDTRALHKAAKLTDAEQPGRQHAG